MVELDLGGQERVVWRRLWEAGGAGCSLFPFFSNRLGNLDGGASHRQAGKKHMGTSGQPLVLPFQHEEYRPLLLRDLAEAVSLLPALFKPLLS